MDETTGLLHLHCTSQHDNHNNLFRRYESDEEEISESELGGHDNDFSPIGDPRIAAGMLDSSSSDPFTALNIDMAKGMGMNAFHHHHHHHHHHNDQMIVKVPSPRPTSPLDARFLLQPTVYVPPDSPRSASSLFFRSSSPVSMLADDEMDMDQVLMAKRVTYVEPATRPSVIIVNRFEKRSMSSESDMPPLCGRGKGRGDLMHYDGPVVDVLPSVMGDEEEVDPLTKIDGTLHIQTRRDSTAERTTQTKSVDASTPDSGERIKTRTKIPEPQKESRAITPIECPSVPSLPHSVSSQELSPTSPRWRSVSFSSRSERVSSLNWAQRSRSRSRRQTETESGHQQQPNNNNSNNRPTLKRKSHYYYSKSSSPSPYPGGREKPRSMSIPLPQDTTLLRTSKSMAQIISTQQPTISSSSSSSSCNPNLNSPGDMDQVPNLPVIANSKPQRSSTKKRMGKRSMTSVYSLATNNSHNSSVRKSVLQSSSSGKGLMGFVFGRGKN